MATATKDVLELATSQAEFDGLWHSVYGVREDVGVVTVNKKALYHLLYDHCQLVGVIMEDYDKRLILEDGTHDAQHEALKALLQYKDIKLDN